MNKQIKILIYVLTVLFFAHRQCKGSLFEMSLEQDAIYTPGKIILSMKVTEAAKFEGHYQFKITISIANTLVREQTLKAIRGQPLTYELTFPEVFDRTQGR